MKENLASMGLSKKKRSTDFATLRNSRRLFQSQGAKTDQSSSKAGINSTPNMHAM